MRVTTSKAYKYVYRTSKKSNYTGLVLSIIVHIMIFLLLLFRQTSLSGKSTLSVTLIEEEAKKEKKTEVKKEIEKKEEKKPGPRVRHKPNLFAAIQRTIEKPPPVNINLKTKIETPKIKISQKLPIEPAPVVPLKNIEIKSVTEDIGPQAKIDLKSLESSESGIGGEIVVGQGVSTSDILKRPAYKPSVDISKVAAEGGVGGGVAPWGPGGGSGGTGTGGRVELKVKTEEPPPPAPVRTPAVSLAPSKKKKKEKKIEIEISGSIAGRKILNKVLPQYPSWAAERGVQAVITVKVEVEPDGTVRRNVIVIGTSGYPQWDSIVKRAVLSWKFAPLPAGSNVIQSGYITFRFVLE